MKIIYLCHFNFDTDKGPHRATFQKLKALKNLVNDLIIVSSKFKKFKSIELIFLELKCIYLLIKYSPNVMISRGYIGYFSQKIAKLKKIKTVREIHADIIEEVDQFDKNIIEKKILVIVGYYMQLIDKQSHIRIFNHPDLLLWFKKKFKNVQTENDIFTYNGFDRCEKSDLSKLEARKIFDLKDNIKYIIFTGGANYWHGVNYLADLQREFNLMNAKVQIICGGGKVTNRDDPENLLLNITPLDFKNCLNLIQAADACILPVRQSRVSPGNALKLYEYFLHNKFVITQKNLKGYSDEVLRYGLGINIDFTKSNSSALKIIEEMQALEKNIEVKVTIERFSWETRMLSWLKCIQQKIN